MESSFSWIPTYSAIAQQLAQWEGRQSDLIGFLERLRTDGLTVPCLNLIPVENDCRR